LIAYFISNISGKNIKIHSRALKLLQAEGGTFLRHGVVENTALFKCTETSLCNTFQVVFET